MLSLICVYCINHVKTSLRRATLPFKSTTISSRLDSRRVRNNNNSMGFVVLFMSQSELNHKIKVIVRWLTCI